MDQRKNALAAQSDNIQSVVRCRPLLDSEKGYSIVQTNGRQKMVAISDKVRNLSRSFAVDQVFGIDSKQIEVYNAVAQPLVSEVLNGFNCTIFAYGQTGSGKTFTMLGERRNASDAWSTDAFAGMIPRCVHELFERLTDRGNEFWVRVTLLELYNEELFDLLASDVEESKNNVKLYSEKDEKQLVVKGLEEVAVRNEADAISTLERGFQRRASAATNANEASSRSHAIFTINVQIKETEPDGREVLRNGRLSLIDLAGSENVGRSGATGKRAAEAGNVNQSLLTFSRVVQALVERQTHVPYRESKLTRLLADALGGRQRTCFFATISPDSGNVNETLATLELASRARSIQNHPEANAKTSARSFIKDLSEELDRVRRDLEATRSKNGIYVDIEDFQQDRARLVAAETTVKELREALAAKITDCEAYQQRHEESQQAAALLSKRIDELLYELSEESAQLERAREKLVAKRLESRQQRYLLAKHSEAEEQLLEEASKILSAADLAAAHCDALQNKVSRVRDIDATNLANVQALAASFSEREAALMDKVGQQMRNVTAQRDVVDALVCETQRNVSRAISDTAPTCELLETDVRSHAMNMQTQGAAFIERIAAELNSNVSAKWNTFESKQRVAVYQLINDLFDARSKALVEQLMGDSKSVQTRALADTEKRAAETSSEFEHRSAFLRQMRDGAELTEQQFATDVNRVCELDELVQCTVAASRSRTDAIMADFEKLERSVEQETSQLVESETRAAQTRTSMFAERAKAFREATSRINTETNASLQSALQQLKEHNSASFESLRVGERERDAAMRQSVGEVNSVLASSSSQVSALRERLAQFDSRISTLVQDASSCLTDMRGDVNAVNDQFSSLMRERADELRGQIKQLHEKLDCTAARHIVKTSQLERVEPDINAVQSQVTGMRQVVATFAEQQLRTDKPTGATPQRETYAYPRRLPRCAAHEELVSSEEHTRFMLDASSDSILEIADERRSGKASRYQADVDVLRSVVETVLDNGGNNYPDVASSRTSCDSAALSDMQSVATRDSCASGIDLPDNQDETVTENTVVTAPVAAIVQEPVKTTAPVPAPAPTGIRKNGNPFAKPTAGRAKQPFTNIVNTK